MECESQRVLEAFASPGEYVRGGRTVACYELFSCGYARAKQAISSVKADRSDNIFGREYELAGAAAEYDFESRASDESVRGGNRQHMVEDQADELFADPVDEP